MNTQAVDRHRRFCEVYQCYCSYVLIYELLRAENIRALTKGYVDLHKDIITDSRALSDADFLEKAEAIRGRIALDCKELIEGYVGTAMKTGSCQALNQEIGNMLLGKAFDVNAIVSHISDIERIAIMS